MTDKALLRTLRQHLEPLGFRFLRSNHANHLVWQHPTAGRLVTVARQGSPRTIQNTITRAKLLLRQKQRVRKSRA
jgi:hypothetical protein